MLAVYMYVINTPHTYMHPLALILLAWFAMILTALVTNAVVDLYRERRKAHMKSRIMADAIEMAFRQRKQ
jgi:hypothetical protein